MWEINEQKYTGVNKQCIIHRNGLGEEPPSIKNLEGYETWLFKFVNINFWNQMSSYWDAKYVILCYKHRIYMQNSLLVGAVAVINVPASATQIHLNY